ncbi:MAG: 4Fe-4S binding protein [Peptococcaceae bacterium]|nr:4Fe-4S binding protein [Peptococcaceae bacterium]
MAINVIGKTIMRNLFSKPATAMYPVVKNEFYPTTRGAIVYDESNCNYCTLCAKRCPSQAITVDRGEKVWQIDRKRCLVCTFCVSVCNKDSLSTLREYTAPIVRISDSWLFQAEQIAADFEYVGPEPPVATVAEVADAVEAVVTEVADAVESVAAETADTVEAVATEVADAIVAEVAEAADAVDSVAAEVGDAVESVVTGAGDTVEAVATEVADAIVAEAADASGSAKKKKDTLSKRTASTAKKK